jgi:hypothetical protein
MSADIGDLPLPIHLEARDLPAQELTGSFVRIHQCRYSALYFGKTGVYRFDAPNHEYGVLYMGGHIDGAFVETFGDVWEAQGRSNIVSAARLASRCVSTIRLVRPVLVCDLSGEGLAQIGADGRLTSGDRLVAQQWSLAIWRHAAAVDGIRYRVRHDQSEIGVALFDRAADAVAVDPSGGLADHPSLQAMLTRYNVALI